MTGDSYADASVSDFAAAVGEHSPAPASGSALAVSAALAAALAELTARVLEDDEAARHAVALRLRLLAIADEDAAAYAAFSAERNDTTRSRTVDVPLDLAETSARVADLAADLERRSGAVVAGDAGAAVELARAAVRAAAKLVEINLGGREDARGTRAAQLAAAARG